MRRTKYMVVCLVWFALWVVCSYLWTKPARLTVATSGSLEKGWQMPGLPESTAQTSFQRLLRRKVWAVASVSEGRVDDMPKKDVSWFLRGVETIGGRRVVLVQSSNVLKRYSVGDTLPDNSFVREVRANSVLVEKNGQEEEIKLYHDIAQ